MYEKQPAGHTRLIPLTAALGLLAVLLVLLLSPGEVRAAAPVITGDATASVAENTAIATVIKTYTASDSDMDPLTWTLEGDDSGDFTLTENSGNTGYELKFSAIPDFESAADTGTDNVYNVTVKVTDDEATPLSDTLDVTITVTNVDEDGTVTIDGTETGGSTLMATLADEDGPPSGMTAISPTWQWTRAATATDLFTNISGATSASYTLVAADVGKFLKATATYTDGHGASKSATSDATGAIAANNNEPSFPSSELGARAVNENTAANTDIGAAVAATGGDSDTLTYALGGTDASSLNFDTTTGQIKTKNALDHETKDSYTVDVTVRDSKDAAGDADTATDDTITVTITVNDVNDAPTITTTDTAESVDENTGTSVVIKTYQASDEDTPGTPQTLTWGLEGTDSGDFDINSSTGALTFKNVPNYESPADNGGNNVYNVTVKVTDNGTGNLSDTLAVTVTVTNVNEAPTFDTTPVDFNKNENTPNTEVIASYSGSDVDADDDPGNLIWTLSGEDTNDFTLVKNSMSNDAELKFAAAPNYEMPSDDDDNDGVDGNNEYEITIKVADDGTLSVEQSITVTVDDVNETPVVSGGGTPSFSEIEYDDDATAAELVIGTYTATDDDNTDNVSTDPDYQTITWDKSGTDAAHFSIDSTTGELSFSFEPDFEDEQDANTDNDYVVVVEADDGQGLTNSVGTFTVTVTVTDENERPHIDEDFDPPQTYMEIEYDSTNPFPDVHDFGAEDYDDGDTFSWSLGGEDATHLDIDSTSGVLTFNQPSTDCQNDHHLPDYEEPCDGATGGTNTYNITVIATDNHMYAAEYPIIVTVTDVNERPDIMEDIVPDYMEVDFYFTGTLAEVHTFTATDYDDMGADPFTWSLDGVDMGNFSIGNTDGILTFNQDTTLNVGPLPSFEDPQDADMDNTYEITVTATDDDSYAAEYDVTIEVTDDEEAGAIAVVHTRNGQEIVDSDLTDLEVDDVLEFILSDPDTIPTPLTDGAIDWVIERRNPGEMNWVALTGQDVTSLTKTYTVDEDDTGKEIRATVIYTDRRGSGKTAESTNTDAAVDERAVAPPRFRSGATQTIPEGEAGRDTEVEIMATDRDGEVLIFGIQDGPNSDLFEILPSDSTVDRMIDNVVYTGYAARIRSIESLDYEALSASERTIALTLTLSDGRAFSNGRIVYDDSQLTSPIM